jgi:hypothetical protein
MLKLSSFLAQVAAWSIVLSAAFSVYVKALLSQDRVIPLVIPKI